jgi:hypothetical protein
MKKFRLLIDLATDRIIWYTDDADTVINTIESAIQAEFTGELPEKMTTANCWNFRYKDQIITDTTPVDPVRISLLDQNRESIDKFVVDKIESLGKNLKSAHTAYYNLMLYEAAIKFKQNDRSMAEWINLIKEDQDFENDDQAVDWIISRESTHRDFMFKTDSLKRRTVKKIRAATTNNELFQIRLDFLKAIKEQNLEHYNL